VTTTPATAAAAAQAPIAATSGGSEAPSNPNGILGQNDFLKLMIAQLQAQNPLEPGNSNEFVNELAQFTQVEQTTNLANASELSGAVQLIGREVTYNSPSGEAITGKVQSAQSTSSGVTVTVEGITGVALSSITNIE
jgi:flagellar basal-body rod modification protein FlgD